MFLYQKYSCSFHETKLVDMYWVTMLWEQMLRMFRGKCFGKQLKNSIIWLRHFELRVVNSPYTQTHLHTCTKLYYKQFFLSFFSFKIKVTIDLNYAAITIAKIVGRNALNASTWEKKLTEHMDKICVRIVPLLKEKQTLHCLKWTLLVKNRSSA